jgi:transcriptional regulator with XRE-family HTH domain
VASKRVPLAAEPWRERLRLAVRRYAREAHTSLESIAYKARVSPVTLSRVINGNNPHPHFQTVVRIAHAIGENVGHLTGEDRRTAEDAEAFLATLEAYRYSTAALMRTIETRIVAARRAARP